MISVNLPLRNLGRFVLLVITLWTPIIALALPGVWTATGDMTTTHAEHTATLLPSGKVLVTGNVASSPTTDLYDPASGTWTAVANMNAGRNSASASLLTSGKVLVAGGNLANNCTTTIFASDTLTVCYATATAELYTPSGNVWSSAGNLNSARQGQSAVVLSSGKVLVVGGVSDCSTVVYPSTESFYCTYVANAEIYDPTSNTWSAAGMLATPRRWQTATLLASGKVLVAGGINSNGLVAAAELYDPANNSWSGAASMNTARGLHTATLLPSGKVYVAGGTGSSGDLATAELYDPVSNTWSAAANMSTARDSHTATVLPSGKVALVGGDGSSDTTVTDLYDPATNTDTIASSLLEPRSDQTATLLTSGKLLIAGGFGSGELASAELFDIGNSTYTVTAVAGANGSVSPPTQVVNGGGSVSITVTPGYTATLLSVMGDTCTLTQTSATDWQTSAITTNCTVTATFLGPMSTYRYLATATLLTSGKVLVAGGSSAATADLFDPATNTWSSGGAMKSVRYQHTATLLPSGKVLVAGGTDSDEFGNILSSTEIYDPASNTWSNGASMSKMRAGHVAGLLPNGKVIVTGSFNGGPVGSAELYTPSSNTWSAAAAPQYDRPQPTSAVLVSGKFLLCGGFSATSQVYDWSTNSWSSPAVVPFEVIRGAAAILSSGKVLLAGGQDENGQVVANVALYNPAADTWSAASNMGTARVLQTLVPLSSGKLLAMGGYTNGEYPTEFLKSVEQYDPATGQWTPAADMNQQRYGHTSTLLPNGQILAAGGGINGVGSDELYGAAKPDQIFKNGFDLN